MEVFASPNRAQIVFNIPVSSHQGDEVRINKCLPVQKARFKDTLIVTSVISGTINLCESLVGQLPKGTALSNC